MVRGAAMSENCREPPLWMVVVLMAVGLAAFIVAAWYASVPCRPGDRGFYIGATMLMAGCPRR